MTPLTPETLSRHELAGLPVEVVAAANPDVVGVAGTVVTETTGTLGIEGADRVWHVPKDGATFAFELPADGDATAIGAVAGGGTSRGDDAGDEDTRRVRVDGSTLVARPARRTERTGDSRWR